MRDNGTIAIVVVALLCITLGKAITVFPYVPLILVLSCLLFVFALVYTEQAMVLLIFAMLLSPEFVVGAVSKRQNIMIRIDDLLIVVFMLAWLARAALTKHRRAIQSLPVNRFILAFCCVLAFSTLKGMISGDIVPIKGFFYAFKWFEYFAVFYLAAGVIKDKQQIKNYIKTFIAVLVIVNIYACTQIGQERVSAPFEGLPGEPNTLGGYQVLLLAIILGLLTHARSINWKWPLLGVVVLTLVPFAFTESRASYMAMVAMYLTLVFFAKGRMKSALIGALMVFVMASFFFFPSVIKERVAYTFTPEVDESITPVQIGDVTLDPSASARINDWVRLFDAWKKRPVFGYGLTGAGFVDSQFISVLVETGLVGLMAFLLLLATVFRKTLRIYKTTKDDFYEGITIGFLAGTVGMITHAFTANTFVIIRIMEPYWFFAAIIMMIPHIEKMAAQAPTPPATPVQDIAKPDYIRNFKFLVNSGWKQ
jgi:hypothetical protein